MPAREFDIAPMTPEATSATVAALTRAFYLDPLFEYFIPDNVRQMRGTLAFMASGVADGARHGEVWVVRSGEEVAAAAVWQPPGAYPRGLRRDLIAFARSAPTYAYSASRVPAALRMLKNLDRAHHETADGPHYYLAILGTDPMHRRVGAASAALRPVLDRCDEEGVPAYLETQREENLAFYARHGFSLVQRIDTESVPPLWTMLRAPR